MSKPKSKVAFSFKFIRGTEYNIEKAQFSALVGKIDSKLTEVVKAQEGQT